MSRTAEAAAVALLLSVTAICCLPSLDAPFTFDEQAGIADNRAVRSGTPIAVALAYRFSPDQSRPLFFLSLLADARRVDARPSIAGPAEASLSGPRKSGLSPRPFRVTNLLLHLTCGVLLYLLLRRLPTVTAPAPRPGDRRDHAPPSGGTAPRRGEALTAGLGPAAALAGTAVFLLHPLQSESIIYIWGRSAVLSTLFILAALALAPAPAVGGDRNEAGGRSKGGVRWAGALLCTSMALASKEEAVVLPLIVFVWWTIAEGRPVRTALRRAVILAAPVVVFFVVRASLLGALGRQVYVRGVLDNILGEAVVTLRMAWLFLLPIGQTIDPVARVPPLAIGLLALVACGAVIGAGLHLTVTRAGRGARRFGAGILIAAAGCVIYWIVPLPDLMSERRLYLPMTGAALAVSGAVVALAGVRRSRVALYLPAAVVVLLLAPAMAGRAEIWSDSRRLWDEAARRAPGKARPLINLGVLAAESGDRARAGELLDRAVALEPMNAEARFNRARLRLDAGDSRAAAADLERAVAANPTLMKARINLGIARLRLGELASAEDELRAALRIDPGEPRALTNLAEVLRATGRAAEALPLYRRALASDPEYAHAAARLGVALEAQGDITGALNAYREYLARGAESPADRDVVHKKIQDLETAQQTKPPARK